MKDLKETLSLYKLSEKKLKEIHGGSQAANKCGCGCKYENSGGSCDHVNDFYNWRDELHSP